jgi:hypothetical protein
MLLKKILYTAHSIEEMNAEDEIITIAEIYNVIIHGTIIENYPEDTRDAIVA